jgi:hypothetical protein
MSETNIHFGSKSCLIRCRFCTNIVHTTLNYKNSFFTYTTAGVLCIFGLIAGLISLFFKSIFINLNLLYLN